MEGQIRFNNKGSYEDFGLEIENINISFPAPIMRKERIPYSNKVFDFSGAGGFTQYEERTIEITFSKFGLDRIKVNSFYSQVVMWLYESQSNEIDIDYYRGTFIGRVEEISSVGHLEAFNKLTVVFTVEPFAQGELYGNDLWDVFNFENDVVEEKSYAINTSKTINIINTGANVSPVIHTDSNMTLEFKGRIYNLYTGKNTLPVLFFISGENEIVVRGTGSIRFEFNKLYF